MQHKAYRPGLLSLCLTLVWPSLQFECQALELYRCTRDGVVEFRQTACAEGEQEITEVIEQSAGITPAEPGLRLERETRRNKPEKSRRRDARQSPAVSERCWKTEKRLETVQRRLRAGYKASQYDGLHRKQSQYEEYLRMFCADD
jgi:hypothetical protein